MMSFGAPVSRHSTSISSAVATAVHPAAFRLWSFPPHEARTALLDQSSPSRVIGGQLMAAAPDICDLVAIVVCRVPSLIRTHEILRNGLGIISSDVSEIEPYIQCRKQPSSSLRERMEWEI